MLLKILSRLKCENLSETLLREFVGLTKTFPSEKLPSIVSLNLAAARREAG